MKRKIGLWLGLLAIVLLTMPAAVPAALISAGDPYPTASWNQEFYQTGVGNFDRMEIFSLTGAGFKGTGFEQFHEGGWVANNFGASAVATHGGSALTYSRFDIHFADADYSTPLSFLFYAFDGSTLKEATRASWNGGWTFSAYTGNYPGTPAAPVPEPGTMMLLGSGLIGLAGRGRKKFHK